jgi:protein-L-isoaspartate(D-aspartate) O-methyltransferase
MDFATARRMMVDGQVRTADITEPHLIAAMLDVPRERFVPSDRATLAYADLDLPVGTAPNGGRCLLKPMVLAKLIQSAELRESDHVLVVGCATGYSAALLGRLARSVTGLEEDETLAARARDTLTGLGLANVTIVRGPLTAGWPASAPYDVILLEGASEIEPKSLFTQLKDGGRLLCIRGHRSRAAKAVLYRSVQGDVSGWPIFEAAAPVLPGFAEAPTFVF